MPAPRVLLVDEGFMSGALAALGLRDAGCDVSVVAATGGRGGHQGRGIRWRIGSRVGTDALLGLLDRLDAADRFDVVVPATEPLQAQLRGVDRPWAARVHRAAPEHAWPLLDSKRLLAEHAAARDIAVPRHAALDGTENSARGAAGALGLPLVVKGERGRGGVATYIADDVAGAATAARAVAATGVPCFAQEFVPGATHLVGGVFHRGEPVRLYAAEKLELLPARTGPSIVLRSTHHRRLIDAALATFAMLEVHGLASADLIVRPDGEPVLLEVNPRPWGSIAAAADAGVDLWSPLAAVLSGKRPPTSLDFAEGVVTRVFPLYLASPAHWRGLRALGEAWADLRGAQGAPWRDMGQATHLLHRLARVALEWPRSTLSR